MRTTSQGPNILTYSQELVFKELSPLKPYKSTGLDEILARFLKEGAVLKNSCIILVNISTLDNCVPDDMKKARVKPLYKKSSNLDVLKLQTS